MKRQPHTAATASHAGTTRHPSPAADTPARGAPDFNPGFDTSRVLFSQTLSAAQTGLAQWEQLLRVRLSAYSAWAKLLGTLQHEAAQAQDAQALMAVCANLAHSQWALAMEQLGAQTSQWMENQMQMADQMRMAGGELARQWMPQTLPPSAPESPSQANGASHHSHSPAPGAEPLVQLGHLQDQWLAATQRWIDVAKSAQTH
jgi:hypothetical protein